MIGVDWSRIRLVVLDVDGTLYDARRLRLRMLRELFLHCLRRPSEVRILRQISVFRRCREELAESGAGDISELQYLRPAAELGVEPEEIRRTVGEWMAKRPLMHLRPCRYAKVADFFASLRAAGKIVAIWSDYPARQKLRALGLEADLVVTAEDPEVQRLKPDPRGLIRILEIAGVPPRQGLVIGDRDERDGEAARRAGLACLIMSRTSKAEGHRFRRYGDLVKSLHGDAAKDAALQ